MEGWAWEAGWAPFPVPRLHVPLSPLHSVSSVHPAPAFPAIQGSSLPALTTQPSPLVSGGFPPPEEEAHSQPVSPHNLHHLHAAYRVGEPSLSQQSLCPLGLGWRGRDRGKKGSDNCLPTFSQEC